MTLSGFWFAMKINENIMKINVQKQITELTCTNRKFIPSIFDGAVSSEGCDVLKRCQQKLWAGKVFPVCVPVLPLGPCGYH